MYQELVAAIVDQFIRKNRFSKNQRNDIIASIKERLEADSEKLAKDQNKLLLRIQKLCNDAEDRQFLQQYKPQLIRKYKPQMAHILTNEMDKRGFPPAHFNHLLEELQGSLTEKLAKGKLHQFEEKSLFRTFFHRVIRNATIDLLRKEQKHLGNVALNEGINPFSKNFDTTLTQRSKSLGILLKMMPKAERKQFEFCIQAIYRLPLDANRIYALYPNCPSNLQAQIHHAFGDNYVELSKGELWAQIVYFLTELEGKKQGLTKLKEWIEREKVKMVSTLLGEPLSQKTLNREAKNLLDHYFETLVHKFYEKS